MIEKLKVIGVFILLAVFLVTVGYLAWNFSSFKLRGDIKKLEKRIEVLEDIR